MDFKILVIDDEYYARKALVMMIQKSSLPVMVSGDFEDGQEVVEYLQNNTADIIITDIRMPGMDGLSIARYVYEQLPECAVIIETGYEDFQYAREALRYKVNDYLTKPIDEEELLKCIRRIIDEKTQKRKQENINIVNSILQNLDFSQLLQNNSMFEYLIPYDFWNCHPWFCMLSGEFSRIGYQRMQEFIKNWKKSMTIRSWYFESKHEYIIILFHSEKFDFKTYMGESFFLHLKQIMDENSWLGISSLHNGKKEIPQAYRECTYSINERILTYGHLFFWKDKLEITGLYEQEMADVLSHAIELGCLSEAEKVIDSLFDRCRKEKANIYSLYNALIQLFSVLERCYFKSIQKKYSKSNYFLFDFKIDLHQFHNADELKVHLKMILKEVCGEHQESENNLLVENILAYLENHYPDDITLSELAEHKYFVSIGHLSRIFKAKTGVTFSKYLTGLRMEKARNFLKNTDFEITDIAAFTGYNDASYFTQIFRKYCGVTPSEYRLSIKNQNNHNGKENNL